MLPIGRVTFITFLKLLKLRKAPEHPSFLPFHERPDPRPASYSFVGRDPRAFFFSRGNFENQPTDKSVAQVTHSLPLAQMKWDESNQ